MLALKHPQELGLHHGNNPIRSRSERGLSRINDVKWYICARAWFLLVGTVAHSLTCSHSRATDIFIESINSPCKFYAHQCASLTDFDEGRCMGCPDSGCAVMGYDADTTSPRGTFYLSTSSHAPYCGMILWLFRCIQLFLVLYSTMYIYMSTQAVWKSYQENNNLIEI